MSTWSLTSRQNKAYLSDSRLVNIYKPFTHKMAAKTSWHTYATKWRHCHPMYSMHHYECVALCKDIIYCFLHFYRLVMLAQFCAILLFLWTSVSAWILALVFQLYERNKLKLKVKSAERPILRQISSLIYPKIQRRQVIMDVLHPSCARPPRWSPPQR